MIKSLSASVGRLANAETMADLRAELTAATQSLGFVSFNLSANKAHVAEFMESPTLTTWEQQDLINYQRDGWAARDPLLHYAGQDAPPLLWSINRWNKTRSREYFEFIEQVGVRSGATIPLNSGSNRLAAMTLLSTEDNTMGRNTLHSLNILAHMALARVSALTETIERSHPALTRLNTLSQHQLEILKWVAQGKTNFEISLIVGNTRRAIDYHVREILGKLAVESRTQAAAIFASSGL